MTRIVIADDHEVMRDGLRAVLSQVEGWQVVGEAGDGFSLLAVVEEHHPDVIILDLSMPALGGLEALERLRRLENAIPILVLSAKDDPSSVRSAMKSGARGFLPKSAGSQELQFAVKALLKGQSYVSPAVCDAMIGDRDENGGELTSVISVLSPREREVMKLLCEGRPNREIAKLLHISPRTIDTHRANIMKKLGAHSNAELVQIALRNEML